MQGTLDLLLLKILALEPLHGWAISQRLKQVSGDVLPSERWLPVSRIAQAGTEGLDPSQVKATENNRQANLFPDQAWRKRAGERNGYLGPTLGAILQVVQLKKA